MVFLSWDKLRTCLAFSVLQSLGAFSVSLFDTGAVSLLIQQGTRSRLRAYASWYTPRWGSALTPGLLSSASRYSSPNFNTAVTTTSFKQPNTSEILHTCPFS